MVCEHKVTNKRQVQHTIKVNEFLDLRLLLTNSRFIDGHLDLLAGVSHDNRSQSAVFSMDILIIHRPETMEIKDTLIKLGNGVHFVIRLVTDNVVNM